MLFHLPYFWGSNLHWAPLRATQSTPSMKLRQSVSWPTYTSGQLRKNWRIFDHCSPGNSTVAISPLWLKCQQNLVNLFVGCSGRFHCQDDLLAGCSGGGLGSGQEVGVAGIGSGHGC